MPETILFLSWNNVKAMAILLDPSFTYLFENRKLRGLLRWVRISISLPAL
jgi:hypothetical protein